MNNKSLVAYGNTKHARVILRPLRSINISKFSLHLPDNSNEDYEAKSDEITDHRTITSY